jgi:hypothetical protein
MQRGIEGSVLDLQDLLGLPRDGVRDRMAVRGRNGDSLQDQQIERALQQVALQGRRSAFRHETTRLST